MIAPWVVYALVLASLIAIAAAAADRLATIWETPRRLTWLAALVVALALPVILATGIGSKRALHGTSTLVDANPVLVRSTTGVSSPASAVGGRVRRDRSIGLEEAMAAIEPHLVALWLLSSAMFLVILGGAAIWLAKAMRQWRERKVDGVRVLIAPETGPAVVGVFRPRIVFPEWALSVDERTRGLMLRHELEHIRARDPELLFLATLSLLLAPWNVALWFIARRLRLAVELDCDRRVVRASGDVYEYGRLLLDVGARRRKKLPIGAAFVERRSLLARRITTMIANKPRHGMLNSVLPVTFVAIVSVAAVRVPRPEAITITLASLNATKPGAADRHTYGATTLPADSIPRAVKDAPRGHGMVSSRNAAGETPRITADWENAQIEDVVAAFAKFSGRIITLAKGVSGLVTVHIVDRPWDEALALIVGAQGYHLVIQSDSSIVISSAPTSIPRSATRLGELRRGTAAQNQAPKRSIVGRVLDDSTNLPIAAAEINVIGIQAIGEPNRACASERGEFQLVVPTGEVWLDATARGYEFSRVTLAASDTIAVFRGRRTMPALVGVAGQIESAEVLKGAAAAALYGPAAANGVVVLRTKDAQKQTVNLGSGLWLFRAAPRAPNAPLFVVDGVVVGPEGIDVRTSCERQ